MADFRKDLEVLINRHSKENGSNTPDFILALFLGQCLDSFDAAVQQRETWYGRDGRPSEKDPRVGFPPHEWDRP